MMIMVSKLSQREQMSQDQEELKMMQMMTMGI